MLNLLTNNKLLHKKSRHVNTEITYTIYKPEPSIPSEHFASLVALFQAYPLLLVYICIVEVNAFNQEGLTFLWTSSGFIEWIRDAGIRAIKHG